MFLGSVLITMVLISLSIDIKLVFQTTGTTDYTVVTTDRVAFNW